MKSHEDHMKMRRTILETLNDLIRDLPGFNDRESPDRWITKILQPKEF